jgi:TPR repeat protein
VDVQTRSAVSAADVSRLGCGGYYPLYLPDGAAMLGARLRSADASPAVDLRIRRGETYYVRVSVDMKSGSRPISRASLIESREASAELRLCRLMPSAYEHDLETMRRAEAGDSDAQLETARLFAEGVKYAYGQTSPQDRAEAYKWFSIVESSGSSDALSLYAAEQRDKLTVAMDAAEMAEAKRRVQAWREAFVPRGPAPAKPQD